MDDPTLSISDNLPNISVSFLEDGEPATETVLNRPLGQINTNVNALGNRMVSIRDGFVYLFGLWERVVGVSVDETGFPVDLEAERGVLSRLVTVEANTVNVVASDEQAMDFPVASIVATKANQCRVFVRARQTVSSGAVEAIEVVREDVSLPGEYTVLDTVTVSPTVPDMQWCIHDSFPAGSYNYTLRAVNPPLSLTAWELEIKIEIFGQL